MKRNKNDAVKAVVTSYLERRNYPDIDVFNSNNTVSRSAEEMAVATIVQCESSRANSILFSCINNDPGQYDTQYTRLFNFIKDLKLEKVKNELLGLLTPLLCHLYLEMLRGGHGGPAQMFLKRHSVSLPQKDLSYHQPIDGNLPSALYRPNSLEQLFNSLQNGTIDNETPEKDYMNQLLEDIGSVYTLQEIETRPTIAAFRSCKFDICLSQDSLNVLKAYLAKHGHVLLIQVLQTWFHIDVNGENSKNNAEDEEEDESKENSKNFDLNINEKNDTLDIFSKCNGHAEYQSVDKELRDLQDAIKSVRDSLVPLKLYKIGAPDTNLICAKTDQYCNVLCGGFSNSEIRLWDLGQNNINRRVNKNISEFELRCSVPIEPEDIPDNTRQIGTGVPLRGHSGPIQAVSILSREELVLSASHDNTMRAWRISDYSCASIYRGHNYPIWCLDVSKNGLFIVTGSHDRTAKLWSLDRTFPVRVFIGHMSDVTCVKFHPNEAYIASGGADRSVRLWSVCDARLVRVLCSHRGPVRALAFSPAGTHLASAGDDKKIKIWDLAGCTCVHEYRGHYGKVTSLDWSAVGKPSLTNRVSSELSDMTTDNSILCSTGMDGIVKVMWDSQIKNKQLSNQENSTSTYNTKCSYLVDIQVHPDWMVAIGSKKY
ncbi:TAF5-like RNA polymerase II p300/CBP-associated factor-associated factor 65 kDa subunit 5L [Colias croceus]|uniref:TAF5-like RNA polymerase II p300/CBP-associated factor-associated factor 65 kDa subunit 5L n=1 Tax=Colias crocea TaxID=72248 RepID=UPI001E27AF51|nr:TAF5-like RNA polymerase II p300/CBP-associated factor-associated factor 65 kDa subunit 5L [Colias croceus]XP_045496474.1 TAF5-like RNA polymerase II p300/CBP-associated factor-associated factor 65 kDa subunit 5L [Colias croceus]